MELIEAMNAKKVPEHKIDQIINDPSYCAEQKFWGIRGGLYINLGGEGARFFSRGQEEYSHKIPHVCRKQFPAKMGGAILDFELWHPEAKDEEIQGWLNTKGSINPKLYETMVAPFDYLHDGTYTLITTTLRIRTAALKASVYPILEQFSWFSPVISYTNAQDIYGLKERIREEGGEGVMYKNLNSYYQPGKRPSNVWWKDKFREDYDAVIIGFTKPNPGKREKWIGAIVMGMYVNGKLMELGKCGTGTGLDDAVLADMAVNPNKYIGKVAVFEAAEQHPKTGKLIEPSYKYIRTDKRPEECTWEK